MPENVRLEKRGPVAHLVLDRPEKHNALRFDDLDLLVDLLHAAEDDDDVRVVVLRGEGPSFCAGHDYDDAVRSYGLEPGPDGQAPRRPSQRSRLLRDRRLGAGYMAFHYALKPVIAQVHGMCTGAGLYLVELVDLAVAADTARFSHAEQRLGLAGNTFNLATLIVAFGPKKARELLLLGEPFDGPTAESIGLVNRSVDAAELDATVDAWAEKVCRNAKDALVMGKAAHAMALASLGMSGYVHAGMVGHALGTNVKFEEGEFNFFRARRDGGTKEAFQHRDAHHSAHHPADHDRD